MSDKPNYKFRDWLEFFTTGTLLGIVFVVLLCLALRGIRASGASAMVSEPPTVQQAASCVVDDPVAEDEAEPDPDPEPTVEPIETVMLYDVPLDAELQVFIIRLCEEKHIEPSIVIAMIEKESQYDADAIGDGGASYGLMQIQPRWHQGRMDRLGVTDLLDPRQNVTVGVDYLLEMIDRYNGDIECALMAYNAGCGGANQHWFSKGIYSNAYSQGVLERARTLREGMMEYVLSE